MTIDKIKYYMDRPFFDFWVNCKNIDQMTKARNELKKELDAKLLTDIKYHAELKLLNYLLS